LPRHCYTKYSILTTNFLAVDVNLEKLERSKIESNISAGGFLNLLKYLSVVVLQD
jgi:hypothetical protein